VNTELLLHVLQRYMAAHPSMKVLDPIENVMRLSDRRQQYQFVKECDVVGESRFSPLCIQLVMQSIANRHCQMVWMITSVNIMYQKDVSNLYMVEYL